MIFESGMVPIGFIAGSTTIMRGVLAVTKYVYDFTEGSRDMKDLLGGKGANLAEMSSIGLPVPPGFTITTEVCTHYFYNNARFPEGLEDEVEAGDSKTLTFTAPAAGTYQVICAIETHFDAGMEGSLTVVDEG